MANFIDWIPFLILSIIKKNTGRHWTVERYGCQGTSGNLDSISKCIHNWRRKGKQTINSFVASFPIQIQMIWATLLTESKCLFASPYADVRVYVYACVRYTMQWHFVVFRHISTRIRKRIVVFFCLSFIQKGKLAQKSHRIDNKSSNKCDNFHL